MGVPIALRPGVIPATPALVPDIIRMYFMTSSPLLITLRFKCFQLTSQIGMKHPSDAELVVQRTINAEEQFFQRIGHFPSF